MLEVLADVLPLTLGMLISPVPIIVAIIIAGSRPGLSNGPAFLAGWFIGLLALVLVFGIAGAGLGGGETPSWLNWVNLVLGLVLLWLAWREWRTRNKQELPGWVEVVDDLKARSTFVIGLALSTIASPKNLPLAAATGVIIGRSGIGLGQAVVVEIIFTIVSSLTIIPAVWLPLTKAGTRVVGHIRNWLSKHSAKLVIPLFLALGSLIIFNSIQGITGG